MTPGRTAALRSRWAGAVGPLRRALSTPAGRLAAPALAVSALALALATQFAYTEAVDIPRLWLGFAFAALLLGGAAAAGALAWDPGDQPLELTLSRNWEWGLLAAIMGLAAYFRVFRFYDFPQGLWYDEAVNGLDAIYILEQEHFTVWRETVQGRSTLYLYLLAGSFKLFGFNMFAYRILPVIAGTAAVFAFYFLARWLVGVVPALIATALFACSRWAVTFSRISWEAALVPLLAVMSMFFLVRGLETKNRFYYFMAGGSLAAGLYTHVSFRMVPVVMALVLVYVLITQWRLIWNNVPGILLYAASFLIVVYPLGSFAVTHQDLVLERTRKVNVFQEVDAVGSWEPLRFNIEASVKMMNVAGDRNGRHNIFGAPMLDEVTASLFVLGLAVSLWSFRSWRRGSIAWWYVLALVPGALTIIIENPSAIRGIGALPPVFLLVGLAASTIYRSMARSRAGLWAFCGIAAVLVSASIAINWYDTFEWQAEDEYVYEGFEPRYMAIGELISDRADESRMFISRDFSPHPALHTLGHGEKFETYTPSVNLIFPPGDGDVLLVPDQRQFAMAPVLQRIYPNMRVDDAVDPFGNTFFSRWTIPAADTAAIHMLPMTQQTEGGEDAESASARLDRVWTDDDLADGPVTVAWDAHFWSSGYEGPTIVRLTAPGTALLEIDGQPYASLEGIVATPELSLVPGEHTFRVVSSISRPGAVALSIETNRLGPLPGADHLYAESLGEQGFRVVYRQGSDFGSPPIAQTEMPFAMPADVYAGSNLVEMQGVLVVPRAGDYGFALDAASSSQLLVDDQLVIDNGGAHAPVLVSGFLHLDAGPHLVAIQYTIVDRPNWQLSIKRPGADWALADGTEFVVPGGDYVPPAVYRAIPDQDWGPTGRSFEGIGKVRSVAVASDGSLVAATETEIAYISPLGDVISTFATAASDIGDIAVMDSGELLVLDRGSLALVVYSRDGVELQRYEGRFQTAGGVSTLGDRAYVASPGGGVLYSVLIGTDTVEELPISAPDVEDRAIQPSDIALAEDGAIYVTDFERQTIVISTDGQTVTTVAGVSGTSSLIPRVAIFGDVLAVTEPTAARLILYDRHTGRQRGVHVFRDRRIVSPLGLAATRDGQVYVADAESGFVYRFTLQLPDESASPVETPATPPAGE